MDLREYFKSAQGVGVLATADTDGKTDMAIYARPHFTSDDDRHVTFIMNDRLSHDNVAANPHASYLFIEKNGGYTGKRLYLSKVGEEADQEKIESMRRRNTPPECDDGSTKKRFLVHFHVDHIRPLVG